MFIAKIPTVSANVPPGQQRQSNTTAGANKPVRVFPGESTGPNGIAIDVVAAATRALNAVHALCDMMESSLLQNLRADEVPEPDEIYGVGAMMAFLQSRAVTIATVCDRMRTHMEDIATIPSMEEAPCALTLLFDSNRMMTKTGAELGQVLNVMESSAWLMLNSFRPFVLIPLRRERSPTQEIARLGTFTYELGAVARVFEEVEDICESIWRAFAENTDDTPQSQ